MNAHSCTHALSLSLSLPHGTQVFGGEPALKLLQQLMVTSHLGVDLHFSTYKQEDTRLQLMQIVALLMRLPELRVCDLYTIVTSARGLSFTRSSPSFAEFVVHKLRVLLGEPSELDLSALTLSETEAQVHDLILQADVAEAKGDTMESMRLSQLARKADPELYDTLMKP